MTPAEIRLQIAAQLLAATIIRNEALGAHETMYSNDIQKDCLNAADKLIKLNNKYNQ